jgi:hypothetical protein
VFFANLLAMIGIVAQATLIVVLVWRRTYRSLPVFFSYIVWGIAGDSTVLILRTLRHSQALYPIEIETYVDLLFQYLVLIELAWSILRPIQRMLPRGFLLGISLIIAVAAVLAWPLAGIKETPGFPAHFLIALHAQRSFAILRILIFLALGGCHQFLSIGWRDRELQVASGLGFYSLVSIAGTIWHSYQTYGWQYYYVDASIACSYLLSLVYWVFCFAQPDAARRQMPPGTQEFLLDMAEVMRKKGGRSS